MEQIEIPLNEVVQVMGQRIAQLEYDNAVATVQNQMLMRRLAEYQAREVPAKHTPKAGKE